MSGLVEYLFNELMSDRQGRTNKEMHQQAGFRDGGESRAYIDTDGCLNASGTALCFGPSAVSAGGQATRTVAQALETYSANDIHHLFGRPGTGPDALLKAFGSVDSAMMNLQTSAQGLANSAYQTGAWVSVRVGEVAVSIKGTVIDGIFRISTIAKSPFR